MVEGIRGECRLTIIDIRFQRISLAFNYNNQEGMHRIIEHLYEENLEGKTWPVVWPGLSLNLLIYMERVFRFVLIFRRNMICGEPFQS